MFSKTIKYEDLDGNPREETFYFHMSQTQLLEMAADGDLQGRILRVAQGKDNKKIFNEFKELVRSVCGMRSDDGRQFDQSPEAQNRLMQSPAFDELVLELCSSATAAEEFVTQLIPKKMQDNLQKRLNMAGEKKEGTPDPFTTVDGNLPAWEREDRDPTEKELAAMGTDELQRAFKRRLQKKSEG